MNVLCPEYPTYGIYTKKDDSLEMDEAIMQDARTVLKYCQTKLHFPLENIILVGRSLGTGVIAQLASEFRVGGSVLVSPYTAVRDVAQNLVGSLLGRVVSDVFRSIDYVDQIKSPVLYIHGEADALIPPTMSVELYDKTKAAKMLTINEEMTHNQFRMESDMFMPMHTFMVEKLNLSHHLYPGKAKTVDSFLPSEPLVIGEVYGKEFNGDFHGGFRKDRPYV